MKILTRELLCSPAWQVDDAYRNWKKPSVIMFGTSDPYIKVNSAFEFLENKRTNMKVVNQKAKVRHLDGAHACPLHCLGRVICLSNPHVVQVGLGYILIEFCALYTSMIDHWYHDFKVKPQCLFCCCPSTDSHHLLFMHQTHDSLQMGAMPQEDFAEAVHESMLPWLQGVSDVWVSGKTMKMTKRGAVENEN